VILDGEGANQTHFVFQLGGVGSAIQSNGQALISFNSFFQQTALKNSNSVILNSNHGFVAGDWIRISQMDSDLVYSSWAIGSVGQIVQIDHVSGDTLQLHSPLRMNYDLSRYPKVTKLIPNEHVGIRCLSIERMDDTAPEQASSISFTNTVHSYIDGISSVKCTFAHVELSNCSNVVVRKSFFKDAFDYGEGGRAYGVVMHFTTNECRIEDNIFDHLRHAILLQAGANGNVCSFNFAVNPNWTNANPLLTTTSAGELVLHGNYVYANLFEQNKVNNIVIDLKSPIQYKLNTNIQLHADFNFSYNQYNPMNRASSRNTILQFDPSVELNKPKYKLYIGVRPTLANDEFALYPKLELTKRLKDTNYVFNAGWTTSVSNNELIELIGQNHWISAPSNLPISSIDNKFINVLVTVNKRFNYGLNMALNDYREIPFFNQTKSLNNPIQEGLKFDVIFEKRAIAIEFNGNIKYQFNDKLLWKNHFKYIQFNLIRENTQAWGILPFEFNSQLNWIFNKNMQFDASGQFWTGAKTSAGIGNAYQLNNTFVLNAGMQYAISDHWTFWGKGENLLDQQYQRWANFPSLGVQFVAGIQYKFRK
jgi:hypothetical protein